MHVQLPDEAHPQAPATDECKAPSIEVSMATVHRLVRTPTLPIYKIIYQSRVTIRGDKENVSLQVEKILYWSQDWNVKHAITGALMLDENRFSQVLEGPSHAVKALFGHIACDKRHANVILLESDYFAERDFGSWCMAYVGNPDALDVKMASEVQDADPKLGPDAKNIVSLLRWLLREPVN